MDQRQCAKCDSLVDVSKAFCPDCGSSMDAEKKREVASEFDLQPETMHMSESGYEMMMQKMDLDTSESPDSQQDEDLSAAEEVTGDPTPATQSNRLLVAVAVTVLILLFLFFLVLGVLLFYLL